MGFENLPKPTIIIKSLYYQLDQPKLKKKLYHYSGRRLLVSLWDQLK